MAKECENCLHQSEFKSVECGSCMVSYYDGEQQGLPSNFKPKPNPKTNADRIRAMSDEELAEFICGIFDDDEYFGKFINGLIIPCYDQYKIAEWLKQPVEDDDG